MCVTYLNINKTELVKRTNFNPVYRNTFYYHWKCIRCYISCDKRQDTVTFHCSCITWNTSETQVKNEFKICVLMSHTPRSIQYWSLLNWQNLRLHCGCVAVPINWFFDIISSCFAKFKNVVHSLEPGETPSYSASHQAPNYAQRS